MVSAPKFGLIAVALSAGIWALSGAAATAGGAPAAYYPSLGYGQTPPQYDVGPPEASVGEPVYQDAPDDDRGPPRGYVGEPAHGGYGYGPDRDDQDYPPPEDYSRSHHEAYQGRDGYGASGSSSYSSQSYGASTSRSEEEYGYDSGWRAQNLDTEHGSHHDGDRGHTYGSASVDTYDYDSGWQVRGEEHGGPPDCRFEHDQRADRPHRGCPILAPREERLPDSFFADAGGVGPDYISGGGGGGGGFVVVGAGAGAGAFASASASAHVSVGVHVGVHGHGGHGGMPHGCGCGHGH